jgi:hypothetical protein
MSARGHAQRLREVATFRRTKTRRGFAIRHFTDLYGLPCSIQESSIATEEAIWFGVDEARRMHLTRAHVKKLLPVLKQFVATGEI